MFVPQNFLYLNGILVLLTALVNGCQNVYFKYRYFPWELLQAKGHI